MKRHFLLSLFLGMTQLVSGFETCHDSNSVVAESNNSICCPPACCSMGTIVLNSEWLFLKPQIDQSHYVISSTNNRFGGNVYPDGKRHHNAPGYAPGWRLEAIVNPCDCLYEIDARFAYFHEKHSSSVNGGFLFDTIGYPGDGAQFPEDTTYVGRAKSKHYFDYYAFDLTLNPLILDWAPQNLALLFGMHFANLHFKEIVTSNGTSLEGTVVMPVDNELTRKTRFWGIGPQLGADYHFDLGCLCSGKLSLVANGRASLLCSSTKGKLHYISTRTGGVGVNIHNPSLLRVTPVADARVGVGYDFCCNSIMANVEVGYEILHYSNCVDSIVGLDVAYAGDSADVFSNLNMHGPYLSVKIEF